MPTEPTQSAIEDPDELRQRIQDALWARFATYPQANPNDWARTAVKVVIECGWRPARLVDLMQDDMRLNDGGDGNG